MMIVVELGLLKDIDMYFFMPDYQQIANEGWFYISKYKYKRYGILWFLRILLLKIKRQHRFEFFEKLDRLYFNLEYENNNNIKIALYKMEHFVHFSEKSCKNKLISHHINIDCSRVIQDKLPCILRIVRLSTITGTLL